MKLGAILGTIIGMLYLIAGWLYFNFDIDNVFTQSPFIIIAFLVLGTLIGGFFTNFSGNKK